MPPMPPITRALLLTCVAAFCLTLFLHLEAWLALWPLTSGRFRLLAISGLVTISAPPPSEMTQQSRRCSRLATIGEFTTSSTVSMA